MQLVEEKWSEILLTVKREHELTDISFNTWLKPLQIFSIQNNRIFVLVSSEQMGLTYINKNGHWRRQDARYRKGRCVLC